MSTEEFSDDFFKGAYALVIGISKYANGKEPGQVLGDKDFPNLQLAAKDAADFAAFLNENGYLPDNVRSLLNEGADLRSIKREFLELSKRCKQHDAENPLVIVYFSGHGWADADERHYLIPFDAERNDLYSTALRNKNFDDLLGDLDTNKLVVFIDACHSGAMVLQGAKGALPGYNPTKELGEGEGRYVIASCKVGQQSWELKQNSIFTGVLLELLKCETDAIPDEAITPLNLFDKLSDRVKKTAKELGHDQEPIIPIIEGATGIVLAINKRVKERRIVGERQDREEQKKFLDRICAQIENLKSSRWRRILMKLKGYVNNGDREPGHENFYGLFDEYFVDWKKKAFDDSQVDECCKYLTQAHEDAVNSARAEEPQTKESYTPTNKLVEAAENKVLGSEMATSPRTPTSPQPDQQQQQRRQLSAEDCEYILEEIMTKISYYSDSRVLSSILNQPINDDEFAEKVNSIADNKRNDSTLGDILQRTVDRFLERWPQAKVVESKTLSSLMMGK